MSIKTKIVEAVASELTKQVIVLLIPLLSALVVASVPQVRDRILPALPKSLLAVTAGLSLSLNLALLFYARRSRKENEVLKASLEEKLIFKFGVLWDKHNNPHCPSCKSPIPQKIKHGPVIATNNVTLAAPPQAVFECIKCDKEISLIDDDGRRLPLKTAKDILLGNLPPLNTSPEVFEPDDTELKILQLLADRNKDHLESSLAKELELSVERVKFHVERLRRNRYVSSKRSYWPTVWEPCLAERGREYLAQKGLL